MDKNRQDKAELSLNKLAVNSVPVSEEMFKRFMLLSNSNLCSELGAAEVIAQENTPTKASELLSWLNSNPEAMVFRFDGKEVSILEEVAASAQGVTRIEHAIHHVYHKALVTNLLELYDELADQEA